MFWNFVIFWDLKYLSTVNSNETLFIHLGYKNGLNIVGFRDNFLNELVRLHHVYRSCTIFSRIQLFPSFLKLFICIEIFFCFLLGQILIIEQIESFPLLNYFLCEFLGLFLWKNLLIHRLAIFAPTLLRKFGKFVGNILLVVTLVGSRLVILDEKVEEFIIFLEDVDKVFILFDILLFLVVFVH